MKRRGDIEVGYSSKDREVVSPWDTAQQRTPPWALDIPVAYIVAASNKCFDLAWGLDGIPRLAA
jgi:hypothetical protein